MKALLKAYSNLYLYGKLNKEESDELPMLLVQLLTFIEKQGIILWHVEKQIVLDDWLKLFNPKSCRVDYKNTEDEIIAISNLCDYFQFQYPGDRVSENGPEPKPSYSGNIFRGIKTFFEHSADPKLIKDFTESGGVVVPEETGIYYIKVEKGDQTVSRRGSKGETNFPFFILTEADFRDLFPAPDQNKKLPISRSEFSKIKNLLQAQDPGQIRSGLTLLEAIGDVVIFDALLEGVSRNNYTLIPNKFFSGSEQKRYWLHTALTGILKSAAALSPKWKAFCDNVFCLDRREGNYSAEGYFPVYTLEYIDCFTNVRILEVKCSSIPDSLNLKLLEELKISTSNSIGMDEHTPNFNAFAGCTAIRKIEVYGENWKDDLDAFRYFTKLEKLDFNLKLDFKNFRWLENCSNLRELEIRNNGSHDSAEGLEKLCNLEKLVLDYRSFRNSIVLESLKNLHEIIFEHLQTSGQLILPKEAPEFKTLSLYQVSVSRLQVPAESNLKIISIEDFKTSDQLILPKKITELESLNLNNVQVTELQLPAELKSLNKLIIKKCSTLKSLSQARIFPAEDAGSLLTETPPAETQEIEFIIEDCPSLTEIKDLRQFNTWNLRLKERCSLPEINKKNKVKHLNLTDPVSLRGIEHFTELKHLKILYTNKETGIKCDLRPLKLLSGIEHLDLSGNTNLTSLHGIDNLQNLKVLDLTDTTSLNEISSLEELHIPEIRIKGSKVSKRDFPTHLQDRII